MIHERLGQRLVDGGLVSSAQLDAALRRQAECGGRLGSTLVELGAISESSLLTFLSQQFGVQPIEDFPSEIDSSLAQTIPLATALKYLIVPVHKVGSRLTVAMVDPSDVEILDDLAFRTGLHIVPAVGTCARIHQRIRLLYGDDAVRFFASQDTVPAVDGSRPSARGSASSELTSIRESGSGRTPLLNAGEFERLVNQAVQSLSAQDSAGNHTAPEQSPVVELVNSLLRQAVQMGVSDIHWEPYETLVRVRFRLDGVLHPVMTYPNKLRNAVTSRLKIQAKLDIAERRLPQDGRFTFQVDSRRLDIRASVLPCLHGEKVVLRVLDRAGLALDLTELGFEEDDLNAFVQALEKPEGMILVTGPTGSGKTTTLYSALHVVNAPGVNIVTVEDPVEYQFIGINQVQVKEEIGLGFSDVLRAVLRQDPDILMIGEIRDQPTAQIAIKAALTGHRVLSTVHTNDSVRTVTRLLDMGIEPFLVSSSVTAIVAQRLVRKICQRCIEPDSCSVAQLIALGADSATAHAVRPMKGRGCGHCHHTGYKGRVAVFEVLPLTSKLRALILERASPDILIRAACEAGFRSLRHNALRKVKAGLTSLAEVTKMTSAIPAEGMQS